MTEPETDRNPTPYIEDLISFAQAANFSGFTDRHLRKLAVTHEIWAVKLGRNWFTTHHAILEYLSRNRKPGPKSQKDR